MTGKTHSAAGAFVGASAGLILSDPTTGLIVGAVSGLLPDVDAPGSILGRRFRPVAVFLENTAGHRTVTHTLWFCLLCGIVGCFLSFVAPLGQLGTFPLKVGVFAVLGSLSHLVLDSLTRSGVKPFKPVNDKHFRGPFVTGDKLTEVPAQVILILGAFLMLCF